MRGRQLTALMLAILLTLVLRTTSRAQPAEDESSYATLAAEQTAALAVPERTGTDPDAAAELFSAGRDQFRTGDYATACRTFERSRQLNTTVAVLLNLGLCYRQTGRFATAHRYYRRAEILATLSGDRRRDLAHDEASTLASMRATLMLRMSEPTADLEVRIDGMLQPSATWSQPMFIDAGEHTITIRAPDRLAWQGTVLIKDGDQHSLIVPTLAQRPGIPAVSELPPPAMPALEPAPAPAASGGGLSGGRIAAIATGSAGLASVGVGIFFGVLAQNEFSESDPYCDGDACRPQGLEHRDRALAHATRSTIFSVAGAVALAGGVILWLASPNDRPESPQLAARAGYLTLQATE